MVDFMASGCRKELEQSQAGTWAYVWNDTNEFKIPSYTANFHYSNPCGMESVWYYRKYTPFCIDCARRLGFIW